MNSTNNNTVAEWKDLASRIRYWQARQRYPEHKAIQHGVMVKGKDGLWRMDGTGRRYRFDGKFYWLVE